MLRGCRRAPVCVYAFVNTEVNARALMTGHQGKESSVFGFDRITANHDILGGKASIRGMRISVALVVNLVANGMSTEEIIAEYPDLEPEDIRQALRYAAWVTADDLYTPLAAAA